MKHMAYRYESCHVDTLSRRVVSKCCLFAVTASVFAILRFGALFAAETRAQLPERLAAWCDSLSAYQQAHVSTMHAFFQIIDPAYTRKRLDRSTDLAQFERRLDEWIQQKTGLWARFKSRLDSCNSLYNAGRLGTPIDAAESDSRWELFIKYGQPANTLVLPCACADGVAACSIWTCTWIPDDVEQWPREISCQSQQGESYPTRIIPGDKVGFPTACPIWPIVNVSRFNSDNGGVDLWFSMWVPGDQFSRATLDNSLLTMAVELYDSTRSKLLARGTSVANLQIIRGVLTATERQYRRFIRAIGYIGLGGITGGSYLANVMIMGAKSNDGNSWVEVSVPDKMAISDLLLLDPSDGLVKNVQPGIIRGSRERLYDNPEAAYLRGADLHLYAEAALPQSPGEKFSVWVTLLALPEIARKARGTVSVGEAVVVADSLDQPVTDGKWQSPEQLKILEQRASYSPDNKAITLLRKNFNAQDSLVVVDVDAKLPSNVKPGRYLLALTISDPEHQSYFLSARRVITVVSPQRLRRM